MGSTGWIELLTAADRQVVALDLRGHGDSEQLYDPARYAGMLLSDHVIAVMDGVCLEHVHGMGDPAASGDPTSETAGVYR
jgi:pimeloyl-ACP methyl ester carboxylesterase